MGQSQPFTRGNRLASAYNRSQMAYGCAVAATSQKGLEQSKVPLNFASTRATLKQQSRHYRRAEIVWASIMWEPGICKPFVVALCAWYAQ